ncbi:hypothetical protein D3C71_1580400 [compost metagenome]
MMVVAIAASAAKSNTLNTSDLPVSSFARLANPRTSSKLPDIYAFTPVLVAPMIELTVSLETPNLSKVSNIVFCMVPVSVLISPPEPMLLPIRNNASALDNRPLLAASTSPIMRLSIAGFLRMVCAASTLKFFRTSGRALSVVLAFCLYVSTVRSASTGPDLNRELAILPVVTVLS